MNYSIGLLSPALGLAVMGFLTGDWVACVAVQTIGGWELTTKKLWAFA